MIKQEVKTLQKFLSANREFSKLRIKNRKLEIQLTGKSEAVFGVGDFSLKSSIRNKLEALEVELGIPQT